MTARPTPSDVERAREAWATCDYTRGPRGQNTGCDEERVCDLHAAIAQALDDEWDAAIEACIASATSVNWDRTRTIWASDMATRFRALARQRKGVEK